VQRHLCLPLRIGLRLADCTLRINPISSERSHRRRCNPAACWNIQADCQHPDHQEWHGCFTDHTSILPGREGRSRWRSSAGVSKCCFHPSSTIHTNQVQSNIPNSTPYGPDQSPPNKERGILHIEKIQPLEILQPRVRQPSISIMIHPNRSATRLNNPRRLTNGPYGIYARDALHNTYSRLTTHSNYETGFQSKGSSANKHRPVPRLPRQPRPAQKRRERRRLRVQRRLRRGQRLAERAGCGITSTTDSIFVHVRVSGVTMEEVLCVGQRV